MYGALIICGYGCNTQIMKDLDLNIYIERWSGVPHSKTRCQIIKEKERLKKTKQVGHLRKHKVLEMQLILDTLIIGTKVDDRLKAIFKDLCDIEDAVTITEICAAVFPEKMFKNQLGEDQPTDDAINTIRGAMSKLRKNPFNRDVTPFSVKKDDGINYYYNVPTIEAYRPVKSRLKGQAFGVEETIDRSESMIKLKEIKNYQEPEEEEMTEEEMEREERKKKELYDMKKEDKMIKDYGKV